MIGPLLMVGSAAAWTAGLILTKVTLERTGADPSAVLLIQLGASVGVLAIASFATRSAARNAWRHGWVGLLEPGLAYQLALAGLASTSAANASVLGSLEPVMVPLLAWMLLREQPSPRLLILVAGATAGSTLVSSSGGGRGSWAGDALIVAMASATPGAHPTSDPSEPFVARPAGTASRSAMNRVMPRHPRLVLGLPPSPLRHIRSLPFAPTSVDARRRT